MPIYKCNVCNYTATTKSNLNKHFKTKNHKKMNTILDIQKKNYTCIKCSKIYKNIKDLDIHYKTECYMHIDFNDIYSFKISLYGENMYGCKGGDIYIMKINYNCENIFKIGRSNNIRRRLKDYRCGSSFEPRLYYYYPFKNIKYADTQIKNRLIKYRIKREIYSCDLNLIRNNILSVQKELDNVDNIEHKPLIKNIDLRECVYCNQILFSNNDLNLHLKNCSLNDGSKTILEKDDSRNKYECVYCKSTFTRGNNVTRHLKKCLAKKKYDEENELKKQLELKDKVIESKDKEIENFKEKKEYYKNMLENYKEKEEHYKNMLENYKILASEYNITPEIEELNRNAYL
jgi:hypothetical protein